MIDRREFLQCALVAAAPLGGAVTAAAAPSAASPTGAVRSVVVDARHAECQAFASCLGERGSRVHVLADGDVTGLWLGVIGPAWRSHPEPLAGLTRASTLFVLEQLAWERRLRVVHHEEYVVSPAGERASPSAWPRLAADRVAAWRPGECGWRSGPTASGLMPALPAGAELLASWIIAPA